MSEPHTVFPKPQPLPARPHERVQTCATGRPRWNSRELLAGGKEVEIEHDNVVYRLRITSLGKLILTK